MASLPRVVVVQPPLLLSADYIDTPYFAGLGALQAAAVLRRLGAAVQLLDGLSAPGAELRRLECGEAWLGLTREQFWQQLETLRPGALVLVNASPYLLGQPGRRWLQRLVTRIHRQQPALVVVAELYQGGTHYLESDPGDLCTLAGRPLVLRYEGESMLERLWRQLAGGERLPHGEVWECREPFPLEGLPAPAWDLLQVEDYYGFLGRVLGSAWRPGPMPPRPLRTLPLVSSRGCPHGCIFCSRNPGLRARHKRVVRRVPLVRVGQWLERWVSQLGLQRVVILDELANPGRRRLDGLLDLLEFHGLRVEFPNGLRADRLTEAQVRRLAARTSGLKVSLESASPRVQRELLHKDLDPNAVTRVAGWCADAGVPLDVHCLVGIPGERRAEIAATLELAARLHQQHGARVLLQNATPLPGTELHRQAREQGLLDPARPAEQLWSAFGGRSLLRTDQFDAELLDRARQVLARRIARPPRKVIVNLTYRCNNHCLFCAVADRPPRDARTDQLREALARHRAAGYELLDIDGGEPTLHPELPAVIRLARQLGYGRVALITNGRRLSYPAYTRELLRAGVHEVLVSLHAADPALAARITGDAASFEQTVAGIRNVVAGLGRAGGRVAVNTTVVAHNLPSLPRLARLLRELGVKRWNLQLTTPFGRASAALLPPQPALQKQLGQLLERAGGLQIQLINCPPCLVPGHEQAAVAEISGKAARQMVFVGAAGENLQAFLSRRRRRTARCEDCIYPPVCPGEYRFDDAPDG